MFFKKKEKSVSGRSVDSSGNPDHPHFAFKVAMSKDEMEDEIERLQKEIFNLNSRTPVKTGDTYEFDLKPKLYTVLIDTYKRDKTINTIYLRQQPNYDLITSVGLAQDNYKYTFQGKEVTKPVPKLDFGKDLVISYHE